MMILAQDQGLNDLRVRADFKQCATGSHALDSLTTLERCCYLLKQCYDPECGQRRKCESPSATTQSQPQGRGIHFYKAVQEQFTTATPCGSKKHEILRGLCLAEAGLHLFSLTSNLQV